MARKGVDKDLQKRIEYYREQVRPLCERIRRAEHFGSDVFIGNAPLPKPVDDPTEPEKYFTELPQDYLNS